MSEFLKFIEFNQYNFPFLLEVIAMYVIFLYLGIVIWVAKDITTRSESLIVSLGTTLLVLVGNIPALLIYLLIRPERTLDEAKSSDLFQASVLDDKVSSCGDCGALVRTDYKFCPCCSSELDKSCPECGVSTNPTWKFCVQCNYRLHNNQQFFNLPNPGKIFHNFTNALPRPSLPSLSIPEVSLPSPKPKTKSKPKLKLPKLSLPKIKIQLPKLKFKLNGINPFGNKKITTVAEKKHAPVEVTKTTVGKLPKDSPEDSKDSKDKDKKKRAKKTITSSSTKSGKKKKKTPSRGRPKGKKDKEPRKKRADAGKKRGSYSK